MRQSIQFTLTRDGVTLAWASAGKGPTLVKTANWLTHLEFEWESPVWKHWMRFLSSHYHFVRYDERGCGMSDWEADDYSSGRWDDDLDAIVDASDPVKPFVLLGISQGGASAISYAVRYPKHVSHLILYGAYSHGNGLWRDDGDAKRLKAILDLTGLGWGRNNPVYRQLFTSMFVPDANAEQMEWFNELCRKTTTPDIAKALIAERAAVDTAGLLAKVSVPTLVVHADGDQAVPLSEGVALAKGITGAKFVQLESRNHILLEDEPAWERFKDEVLRFTGLLGSEENTAFSALSPREFEILSLITKGLSNKAIGNELFISEKTVRNHITRIFEKINVRSRAEAIVLAKDRHLTID